MNLLEKINQLALPLRILAYIAVSLFIFLLCAYCVGAIYGLQTMTTDPISSIILGVTKGWKWSLLLTAGFVVIIVGMSSIKNRRNQIDYERDGIFFAKDKNSGSADWQSEKEVRENYYVGNIKDTTSTVYGKLPSKGSNNVVSYKVPNGPEGNRNTLILAPMGSGKTFTYVETEVLQTILRGDSLIINDPKGEVFMNTAKFAEEHGATVKALMIGDYLAYTDFWNCLKETIDPESERVEAGRLQEFCRIYMENSTNNKKEDFFFNNGLNLMIACTGYLAWRREKDIIDNFVRLYKKITGLTKDYFIDTAITINHPMSYFRDTLYKAGKENGYSHEEVEKAIREIEKNGSKYKYTIGEVYDMMFEFKDKLQTEKDEFEKIPLWHPAATAYKTFIQNAKDSVADSACQTVLLAMNIFNDVRLKEALSNDGIVLSEINKKQCAFYLVSSDKPGASVYKPILSLFFSFFFKDAMTTFDHEQQVSATTGRPNRCKGITAMMEEAYSLGHINNFDTVMTTCRSRHIYVSVIIQHIKLLEEMYGKNIQNTIISGCKTLYFLGANDPDTMKFVSDFAGTASILKESHHEEGNLNLIKGTDMNVSTSSRQIITPDEARRWKQKVLIIRQGDQPLELEMFPWTEHWALSSKVKKGYIHFDFEHFRPYPDSMMPFAKYNDTVDVRFGEIDRLTPDAATARQRVTLAISQIKKSDESDKPTESIPIIKDENSEGNTEKESTSTDRAIDAKTRNYSNDADDPFEKNTSPSSEDIVLPEISEDDIIDEPAEEKPKLDKDGLPIFDGDYDFDFEQLALFPNEAEKKDPIKEEKAKMNERREQAGRGRKSTNTATVRNRSGHQAKKKAPEPLLKDMNPDDDEELE